MSAPAVDYAQSLPRKLVHKWGLDQVFLTSSRATGEHETVLGAVLPRSHGFYCEFPIGDRAPDLALLIEVCRQACFVVAHTRYEVPVEGNVYQFLLKELSGEYVDTRPLEHRDQPIQLEVRCTVERVWRRGSVPSGLIWAYTLHAGDTLVARARMRQTWIDRTTWREMRVALRTGRGLPPQTVVPVVAPSKLTPAEVGRINPANVVLEQASRVEGGYAATIRADIRHPVLFDHPIDHIYAMVQLEACRQLSLFAYAGEFGVAASDVQLCAASASFLSVAEFDMPTVLHAVCGEPVDTGQGTELPLRIEIRQKDRLVSEFAVTVGTAGVRSAA